MMLEMSDACHLLCLYTSLSRLLFPPLASSLSRPPPGQTPFLIHLERVNLAEARVSVCFANVSFFKNMCAACCCFSLHQAPRGAIEGRSCCGKRGHLRVTATVRVALLCFHQLHSRKSHQLGTGSNMEARVQGCVCAFDSNGERK